LCGRDQRPPSRERNVGRIQRVSAFVLASGSPRRSDILSMLGIDHVVFKPEVHEDTPPGNPADVVRELSERKAKAAASALDAELVLSADTIVVLAGEVMGKPASEEEAREMLGRLSGRWHLVYTGLTLLVPETGRTVSGDEVTSVKFKSLEPEELQRYVGTGEPLDKAGAYGIQGMGSTLVERVEGCYYNVVGLPVARLLSMLGDLGYRYGFPGLYRG
jgi:septum formation protein